MDVDIASEPSFAFGEITLPPGVAVRFEAAARVVARGSSGPAGWVSARLPKSRS